jgi:hypothetical protein
MKRILLFSCIIGFFLLGSAVFVSAQNARITDVQGKVEVNQGTGWTAARAGMTVPLGTVISTGFGSKAFLQVGMSKIEVKPLTRMSVAEYMEREGSATTSLDLRIGRVKATVESAEGVRHDFTIKSPTSTASVRGTEFTYDGYQVNVTSGRVMIVMNESGVPELVFEGERSGGEAALADLFETDAGGGIPTTTGGTANVGTLVISLD